MTAVEAPTEIVDQILEQLEPIIGRQRKALVEQGCFRHVSSTQLHVLYLLVSHEPTTTMSHLADQLGVSLPNATGLIERMFDRGIVERVRQEDDRRVVGVRITAAGREILDEIDMVKRQAMADVIGHLTPQQQERALRTFTDMRVATEQLAVEESQTPGTANDPASSPTRRH